MNCQFKIILCLLSIFLLQACAGTGVAPVTNRSEVKEPTATTSQNSSKYKNNVKKKTVVQNKSGYHIVSEGDTLYSIAWRYNFDYKQVANWNEIKAPYTIYPGQVIRLKSILKKKGTNLKNSAESAAEKTVKQPLPKKEAKPVTKKATQIAKKSPPKSLPKGPVKWNWPTTGKISKTNSPTAKKGLNILGRAGQRVKAAATGEVVYSGGGLVGYGKLIIIKHNDTYLSAYAYNSKLLVKEGDIVKAGQAISEMGQDHTGSTLLHFEIRKNGKPVNPTQFLPKKRT
jgi:lipoprotein NlpD